MAKALVLNNGVPRMLDLSVSANATYDESFVTSGTVAAGTPIQLPNNGSYVSIELMVWRNGLLMEHSGVDYNYVGNNYSKTEIAFVYDIPDGTRLRFRMEDAAVQIYDSSYVAPSGGVTTGTPIALPGGEQYNGEDLSIYLNGEAMEFGIDWNSVGAAPPYTQVQFTFDLVENDRVRFRRIS